MTSIRQRLLRHLILVWTLLLAAGLGLVEWSARTALTRQFDNALRAKAMALSALTEQDDGRLELELSDEIKREFETNAGSAFFQIWHADGRVVERSPSLRQASLPLHHGSLEAPAIWDLALPTGLAGRAVGLQFRPQMADETAQQPIASEAILVVAIDRRGLDRTLATLRSVLMGCGLLLLGLTSATVPILLRRELAPLDRLAELTQRITPQTLSARFPTDGLPGELVPISRRLNDLLSRLETAFEHERRFSDNLAHEFRTPIAELRSLAELSLKWPDTRSADTDRTVLAIAVQMEAIINRLLIIARSELGKLTVSAAWVDVAGLVTAVCQPLQARAQLRQLAIEMNLPPAFQIQSDPVLLRSIVTNLVENALEYSPARATVRIQSQAQNGQFALEVTNPVEGLGPDDLPRLFERFWRKDVARSSAEHSGLGLPLARAFAASLGYTLAARLDSNACLAMTLSGPVNQRTSKQTQHETDI